MGGHVELLLSRILFTRAVPFKISKILRAGLIGFFKFSSQVLDTAAQSYTHNHMCVCVALVWVVSCVRGRILIGQRLIRAQECVTSFNINTSNSLRASRIIWLVGSE